MKKTKAKNCKKTLLVIMIVTLIGLAGSIFWEKEAKILFVGDMMFDRHIRKMVYEKSGDYIFSCKNSKGIVLSDFLQGADLVVGNLEGPITENASVSMFSVPETPNNYTFTFPTNTANLLAKNNIKLVSLDNNHINNFGEKGVESTKKYLIEAGVDYFDKDSIYRTKIGGMKMSFISYNEFLSAQAGSGENIEKTAEKIKEEKAAGRTVFVYAHWGDEYIDPPWRVKNTAKIFAEAGADFIIGSHPHIVQSHEQFGDTDSTSSPQAIVYYSLGNFIFDQYWNEEVSTGLALEIKIKGDNVEIIEHPVSLLVDGRTCLNK
ncbi:MAG: CapA family protein [Candidatus Zambryskibacteria bacterium]|nr:CapA family protein [Candidatus Zambryskibacteria bacterium]